jgi:MFS family permease
VSNLPPLLRALRNRNYRLYVVGQLVSLVGTWMQTVAQNWLVYRLTGSPVQLGLIGFAGQIPVFLLSPIGGAVADRFNRPRVLLCTQAGAGLLALLLAVLTFTERVEIWHVFTLALLFGVVFAFDVPARHALIAEMVDKTDMTNAIALNSSMVNGARIIGPAIAGLTVAAIGEGWCFLVNAVSYLALIASLFAMRLTPPAQRAKDESALHSIVEGFQFVARTAPIRALLLMVALSSVMGLPYTVLMPIFADQILQGGAGGYGVLMATSGAGALIGALTLASRTNVRGLGTWVAVATAAFGLSLIMFSISRVFWLSALLLVPVGYFLMVQLAASITLIQAMVPNRLRGRVMAAYSMMFFGMSPFGALLSGALAGPLGAPMTVALGGLACVLGSLVFGARLPALRAVGRQLIVAQELAAGDPPAEVLTPGRDVQTDESRPQALEREPPPIEQD